MEVGIGRLHRARPSVACNPVSAEAQNSDIRHEVLAGSEKSPSCNTARTFLANTAGRQKEFTHRAAHGKLKRANPSKEQLRESCLVRFTDFLATGIHEILGGNRIPFSLSCATHTPHSHARV
jgi:hypothetical protein